MTKKAIECTEQYLEFSSQNESQKQGRLQDIVNVLSNVAKLTEDGVEIYEMELNKPLKSNDFLIRDKHHKKEYWANRDFNTILADRKNNKVFIKFHDSSVQLPTGLRPNVEISFDLRILIINEQTLLEEHSFDIAFPRINPTVETSTGYQYVERFEHPSIDPLNEEQELAVHTMLTQPLSFIKGPPGVGKTVTVAIPILSYMAKGIPVAIITPTHVSLERSLSAINEMCLRVGIDLERVIRLGASSQWYAEAYPQTLESPDAQEFLQKENLDLLLLETTLEYRSMQEQIKQKDEILLIQMLLDDIVPHIEMITEDLSSEKRNSLLKMISIKIKMMVSEIDTLEAKSLVEDIDYRNFYDRYNAFSQYVQQLIVNSEPLSKKDRDLLRINKLAHSSYGNRVELYEELIGTEYDHLSDAEIHEQITQTKIRIERFSKEYAQKKLQQAYLIGMTADSYNSRYKDEPLNVKHIFIDEGGYLPLIKAYGMCRSNIPLSILGDPQQLPPVSEMNNEINENGEYESVLLYDMSAFHLGTLFQKGYEGLKRAYFDATEPNFSSIPKVDLLQTYRFGNKLADILDQYVYKNGFTSAIGDGGFELHYINAVNEQTPPGSRVNPAEAEAIRSVLELEVNSSIAVLTPYKNQVAYLKKELKGVIDPNQIMSIHKSQGQEWDTVIISVVDHESRGIYGMWFTDTTNKMSKGLKVINTVVSRAKKRLILVGHYGFWITQSDQLLGELFRNGECIDNIQL